MTSILTNIGATNALQALRSVGSSLSSLQDQVSSGLRVKSASDNVAYWSISTTMKSDNKASEAARDALELGAQTVEVAYSGIESVGEALSEFKAKLVTARETSVDKSQIQLELDQLKEQIEGIATSASFNGVNWLTTDIEDINDSVLNRTTLTTSFTRSGEGVSIERSKFDLSQVSLFNSTGGGLLQADSRNLETIGGMRISEPYWDVEGVLRTFPDNQRIGPLGQFTIDFAGPITFGASDKIEFDVTVDVDNTAVLPPPHDPGRTTSVTIDRALIDTVLPGKNGKVTTYEEYSDVLGRALSRADARAGSHLIWKWPNTTVPNKIVLGTTESSGLNGSSIQISNLNSTVNTGGLTNTPVYFGDRSEWLEDFKPFEVYVDGDNKDGVEIQFSFSINNEPATHYKFNRTYVNDLLGKDTGQVETAAEMVTLLKSFVSPDWPDVIIEEDTPPYISIRTDTDVDRLAGNKSRIGFTGMSVSIEPISTLNLKEVDIHANPEMIGIYTGYVELLSSNVTKAGATLGALKSGIEMQQTFSDRLMDNVEKGISRLVDADMEEASAKLAALQTQQQLAIQGLQIANNAPDVLLQLYSGA
ncbi:flagellin [Agrobacterium rosae]|uniref:flagellin N-terminal helical domain-containing protein n=1 Tax=Agrobacterium rosae TaxID=1972867 RepID=UPI00122EDE82|nr:flagellin [Agrobacterium rosae]KAA3506305.1 flagellin/flagellar hook associated protein [Agrobacterium rosae]KAA3510675.1 flagellin/flagellar hook associated protein [Agrobacterium rosae]MQB51390.1 flagellin/flagellar hook associated protein [Agrobacterium rosae]